MAKIPIDSIMVKYILKVYMPHRALSTQIRLLRARRGLTQAELARRARLSWIYIAKIEGGDRESPSLAALARIARALGARLRVELVGQ